MPRRRPALLWTDTTPAPAFPALGGDLEADVAVVGAGFTGLTTAWRLKQEGLQVAVLERGRVALGESGNTTAHLSSVVDTGVAELLDNFGLERAQLALEAHAEAIAFMERAARELGPPVHLERLPAYLYAEPGQDAGEVRRQGEAMRALGLDAHATDDVPLPFAVEAAVRIEGQARMNPRPYLLGLARSIDGDGSFVFEDTIVRDHVDGAPVRARTDRGTVTAKDLVLATNIPLGARPLFQALLKPYRTYVLAAWVHDDLPGLFWDVADPYHYLRTQPLGDRVALLVGGEDHLAREEADTEGAYLGLERYARERFPPRAFDYRWSGEVVEPADGLAYIGRLPGERHVWGGTGYAGNGTTYGTLAGMLLGDLLVGRPNPWADLFDPARPKGLAAAGALLERAGSTAKHVVADRLAGSEVPGPEALEAGDGAVLVVGAERLAVYRDEGGSLHALSPVCTHMACVVGFNRAERTWDCACHGSRFDARGKVLNGPATADLEPKELPAKLREGEARARGA